MEGLRLCLDASPDTEGENHELVDGLRSVLANVNLAAVTEARGRLLDHVEKVRAGWRPGGRFGMAGDADGWRK